MSTINVSDQINSRKLVLCKSTKELMNNREFYILLERFCNDISKTKSQYNEFLNYYFNDEGFVDIWRIPHLMIDIFNQKLNLHKLLECQEFRITFHKFLAELYNYCLSECQPALYVNPDSSSEQNISDHLRVRHQFLSALMVTFINVMDNIENFKQVEMEICTKTF